MTRQEQEPCEVVVLSLAGSRQARLPALELLLGARMGKFPVAPKPDHDLSAAAEHRMTLAVRHLTTIGCRASGLISDENLLPAVRSETRGHSYDEVILATGQDASSRLSRALHLDPVHRLRRRWGRRLTAFAEPGRGPPVAHLALVRRPVRSRPAAPPGTGLAEVGVLEVGVIRMISA